MANRIKNCELNEDINVADFRLFFFSGKGEKPEHTQISLIRNNSY